MKRDEIFEAIANERARQDAKFPGQWSTFSQAFERGQFTAGSAATLRRDAELECNAILAEEAGEVAKAVLERDDRGLEFELVQVAAVCVAWLEARS